MSFIALDKPLVSVLMPVYNGQAFLDEAIASVVAQTYPNWEFVVLDDGSTDASLSIAERHAARDSRIRVLRNESNLGISATRNRLFLEAEGRATYFALFDADDVCMPERLERQVAFLERHPDHALVGCHTLIIDEQGERIGTRRYPTTHEAIMRAIGRYNPFAQPGVLLRRSAIEAVGAYDPRYDRCEDYDLWLRIAARFKVANLDAFALRYRLSPHQGKSTALRQSLRFTIKIQRKWLFNRAFFRPLNLVYWVAELMLLLLPDRTILAMFARLTYGRAQRPNG